MDDQLTVDQLITRIKDKDAKVRAAAWLGAGQVGAAAVKPLAALMTEMDAELARLAAAPGVDKQELGYPLEVGRSAKRALWAMVRHVGRPGADRQKRGVAAELCELLGNQEPAALRREVLWMLSEIGGDQAVEAIRGIPGILQNKEIRDDARCAVERIPGEAATRALRDSLEEADDEFRLALAHSLRVRGVEVDKRTYPPQKLVPTKQPNAEPVGR